MREDPDVVKSCCASLYGNAWMSRMLGDSWHPGGDALTLRLGRHLKLTPRDVLVDVATGEGASARLLAQTYGCRVIGIDYGSQQITRAVEKTYTAGLSQRVTLQVGDAEALPLDDASADVILCECALCTFPSPRVAVREWARVLRPGGRVGLTDVTRTGPLPPELDGLLAWVACITGARSQDQYQALLQDAGFTTQVIEPHPSALLDLASRIQSALVAWAALSRDTLEQPTFGTQEVDRVMGAVSRAIAEGRLGYTLITATHP